MLELTINGVVYTFRFGMGFLREIDKKVTTKVDGTQASKDMGLQFYVASILDGDVAALIDVLNIANMKQNPRVTRDSLDAYIDDECEDIDELFDKVINFLSSSNATKKVTVTMIQDVEKAKAMMNM